LATRWIMLATNTTIQRPLEQVPTMREDERMWAVKELLFDYVKSPSLRHIRDAHSVIKLAQEIVRRVDRGNSIWQKWDGQREVLLKSALPCWIPIEDLRDFLNRMPGPALTTTDVAQRLGCPATAKPLNGSSKNETPKNGRGDRASECLFSSPIPDTETKRDPRNAAVQRGSEASSHVGRWRPDWLAGAAGFETSHSGIKLARCP
jgi:hypothetical protein